MSKFSPEDSKIQYSFFIGSAIMFLVTGMYTAMYLIKPTENQSGHSSESVVKIPKKSKIILIIVAAFCFHCYMIVETYGRFLTIFAVNIPLQLSKDTGAALTSLFFGSFAVTFIIIIFLVMKISLRSVLSISLGLLLIGNSVILSFGSSNETALWIGTIIIGCGTSGFAGNLIGFVNQYIPVTSKLASLFYFSLYASDLIYPLILGKLMESSPMILIYMTFSATIIICLLFGFINCFLYNFIIRETTNVSENSRLL